MPSTTPSLFKRLASYWTVWLGVVLSVLAWMQTEWNLVDDYLPEKWRGPAWLALGVTIIVLRGRQDILAAIRPGRDPGAPP